MIPRANITRYVFTYGHVGMNKLVVNHLDKTIVTSDGATIVQELEVMHPAAKMVVLASQMQEQEAGDGTSLVVTLTGERSSGEEAGPRGRVRASALRFFFF